MAQKAKLAVNQSTRSKISYNIHGQNVPDSPKLLAHLDSLKPTTVLVMDALGLAKQIQALLPDCIVIHRNYGAVGGDDDAWTRFTPEKWLDLHAEDIAAGVWLYVCNEPGWGVDVLDWHVRLMELAVLRRAKLVIGNWAVGTPLPEQWPMARHLLELCNQHRDLFILALHEYGCGVLTSGLFGGAPDGTDSKGNIRHANYIMPDAWLSREQIASQNITRFHCGRFNFMVEYCRSIGLKPPRVIITEHGMDDVSDIKFWSEKLRVRKPYLNIRGWKTLIDQWTDWFRTLGWSPERAYFEQLRWADKAIYRDSIVEGQLIYCWGHSSQMWEQFDVAEANELHGLLQTYAEERVTTEVPVVTPPVVVTPPEPPVTPPIAETPTTVTSSKYAKIVAALRQLADALEELDAEEVPAF